MLVYPRQFILTLPLLRIDARASKQNVKMANHTVNVSVDDLLDKVTRPRDVRLLFQEGRHPWSLYYTRANRHVRVYISATRKRASAIRRVLDTLFTPQPPGYDDSVRSEIASMCKGKIVHLGVNPPHEHWTSETVHSTGPSVRVDAECTLDARVTCDSIREYMELNGFGAPARRMDFFSCMSVNAREPPIE